MRELQGDDSSRKSPPSDSVVKNSSPIDYEHSLKSLQDERTLNYPNKQFNSENPSSYYNMDDSGELCNFELEKDSLESMIHESSTALSAQSNTAQDGDQLASSSTISKDHSETLDNKLNDSKILIKKASNSFANFSESVRSSTIVAYSQTPTQRLQGLTSISSSSFDDGSYGSRRISFNSQGVSGRLRRNMDSTVIIPSEDEDLQLPSNSNSNVEYGPFDSTTFDRQLSIEVNQPVGAMSLSPCGRDIALASRYGLLVLDLDNPYNPPRMLRHSTPWEVADTQWNVHAARDQWVVSTSSQKTIVWNLALPNDRAIEFMLHGHTRAVTDMNWHRQNPDVLATCSIDSSVHCWDLRSPRFPVNSFYDWHNGATQVKWNYKNPHILASSHGRLVRIWDDRYGSAPLHTIKTSENITKINGLEFNRACETRLLTCAMDRTVKFWNYEKSTEEPEHLITTDSPVWKARFTPFGDGVILMPQRGDNSVHMYDCRNLDKEGPRAVHRFAGHTDQVKEFLWRCRGEDVFDRDLRDFQLITWSKDHHVRLWPIGNDILNSMGHDRTKPVPFKLTRLGAKYRTYSREPLKQSLTNTECDSSDAMNSFDSNFGAERANTSDLSRGFVAFANRKKSKYNLPGSSGFMTRSTKSTNPMTPLNWLRGISMGRLGNADWEVPQNLGEELSWIGQKYSNVSFEKIDVAERTCTISLNAPILPDDGYAYIRLHVYFPNNYPISATPVFQLERSSAFNDEQFNYVFNTLTSISDQCISSHKYCMDACLSYLSGNLSVDEIWKLGFQKDNSDSSSESSADIFQDVFPSMPDFRGGDRGLSHKHQNIPLPKTCAAIFCGNDELVCFFTIKADESAAQATANRETHGRQKLFESFGVLDSSNSVADSDSTNYDDENSLNRGGTSESDSEFIWDVDESNSGSIVFPKSKTSINLNNINSASASIMGSRFGAADIFMSKRPSTKGSNRPSILLSKPSHDFHVVRIISMSKYLPVKRALAAEYVVDTGDKVTVCNKNAEVSAKHNYYRLAKVWLMLGRLLGHLSRTENKDHINDEEAFPWLKSPLAKWVVNSLLDYYASQCNTQMLAMLACVLDIPNPKKQSGNTSADQVLFNQPKQVTEKLGVQLNLPKTKILEKVSSHSLAQITALREKEPKDADSTYSKEKIFSATSTVHLQLMDYDKQNNDFVDAQEIAYTKLLQQKFIQWRATYAEQLDLWGFFIPKLEMLKFNAHEFSSPSEKTLVNHCNSCNSTTSNTRICEKCYSLVPRMSCTFCCLSIHGLCIVCGLCLHVMHEDCYKEWFSNGDSISQSCSSGCGCKCQFQHMSLEKV
ncbi:Ubiquitin-protein ligase E3 [Schizosaccharomyces pombe]